MGELKIDNQENLELELLQDKLEYLQLKGDFFEDQTDPWGKLIIDQELKNKESLEEEQKLIKILNERKIEKEKLISDLKALKDQVNTKASKRTWICKNGYFECPECSMKSKWKESVIKHINVIHRKLNIVHKFLDCPECHFKTNRTSGMKDHINAVHHKLRPYKCSDCDKGWSDKSCAFQKYLIIFFSFI